MNDAGIARTAVPASMLQAGSVLLTGKARILFPAPEHFHRIIDVPRDPAPRLRGLRHISSMPRHLL